MSSAMENAEMGLTSLNDTDEPLAELSEDDEERTRAAATPPGHATPLAPAAAPADEMNRLATPLGGPGSRPQQQQQEEDEHGQASSGGTATRSLHRMASKPGGTPPGSSGGVDTSSFQTSAVGSPARPPSLRTIAA